MPEPCPIPERFGRLLKDELPAADQAALVRHLDACAECRHRLEQLVGDTDWLPAAAEAAREPARAATPHLEQAMRNLQVPVTAGQPEGAGKTSEADLGFLSPANTAGVLGCLGTYEILEEISRGGMGIVFKARDCSLDRIVAIKVLPPQLAHRPGARERFLREARAAAAVTHENVITIHAVEETPQAAYLVMQFIAGKTLEERLRRSAPLPLVELLRIGYQTASGLAAAHALGLIHRDIKPGNLLLENSVERVKITDFGLARAAEETTLTQSGQVAGTPEYMAPEQVQGAVIDQRADLFSLGCVFYRMATGRSPFRGPNLMAVLRNVCQKQPAAPRELNPDLPEWLSQLIARLLAKDPAERPQTAQEVARKLGRQLARLHRQEPLTDTEPGPAPRRAGSDRPWWQPGWRVGAAAGAGLGGLLLLVLIGLFRPSPAMPFAVMNATAGGAQFFETLGDAVAAASAGAVIECRFNGEREIDPLDLKPVPLVIRAAAGYDPVLMPPRGDGRQRPAHLPPPPNEPLLRARAPVVIEGLTFQSGIPELPPGRPPPGVPMAPALVAVMRASALFANCHFNIAPRSNDDERPLGCCVHLGDVSYARFENCGLFSGPGIAIAYRNHFGPRSSRLGSRIVMRNCVHQGWALLSLTREAPTELALELSRCTIAANAVLEMGREQRMPPCPILTTQAVFDVRYVLRAGQKATRAPGQALTLWQDTRSLFSIREAFTDSSAAPRTLDTWPDYVGHASTGTLVTSLRLLDRLTGGANPAGQLTGGHFVLSAAEQAALAERAPGLPGELGANPQWIGPGAGYEAWRRTPEYETWQTLVQEQLQASF